MQKKQLLGRSKVLLISHVKCVTKAYARYWMHDTLQKKYPMLKVSKKNSNKYKRLHLRSLFVMSKVLYTHINRMKPLPQYVHTDTAVDSSLSNSK